MAPRGRRRESELAFEALSIEGGLLAPEWLARVAQLQAGQQAEADYRIPKGLSLRDEIGRYWRVAQAHWKEFAAGRQPAGDSTRARALSERFVRGLLIDAFGFTSLQSAPPVLIDTRTYPIGFAALGGRVPVVVAPAGGGVDSASPAYGDEGRRRSPFGLLQEFLNAAPGSTWGLVSDGWVLRIARDNASLTRPAWIEADLVRLFQEESYADFALLWLLAHESRFGPTSPAHDANQAAECALEAWREASREEGTRARDTLRDGFEDAIRALGQGFLIHPANALLRESLQNGAFTKEAYFQQILRLVYRLIFLLTVEERSLLHVPGTPQGVKDLYRSGYSLTMLRERAVRRSAHDRFSDFWRGVKISFRGLADGEQMLGLPAMAGLFAKAQCAVLDASELQNRFLLHAIFRLSWLRERVGLVRVNWRDMGPEELGSVYESLLELVPQISADWRQFTFAVDAEAKGNARKTTGSYYTPDSLVQVLLDSALEPVIADTIARNPDHPIEALLGLSIVDPACGSGHFLLAAARRLAGHIARLQANATPSAAEYRHALRQVIGRCIYGVDQNPMAVELCQVSLWMEAVEPGLPLTFLDSHIQCGNALLGTTPALTADGVPDAAWEPIQGDDKKVASALKRRNKQEAAGFRELPFSEADRAEQEAQEVAHAVLALEEASDTDVGSLAQKVAAWERILDSPEYRHQRFICHAWCAAFVWPKQIGSAFDAAPTHDRWRRLQHGEAPSTALVTAIETIATQYRFFHWHLQFSQVFEKGGFDVVLGNPPWEQVELKEEEWFASRRPDIAEAPNAAARKKRIAQLATEDPVLLAEFGYAKRRFDGETHLIRESGRFPLCARGRINTYAVFAEHNCAVLSPRGRAGFIVPGGLVTDDTTKDFFASLVTRRQLASCYHFENEEKIFVDVHNAFRFALLSIGSAEFADLLFFARNVDTLKVPDRHVQLSPADFEALNPNTRTCPTFRTRRDADINLAMYRRTGILWRENDEENGNPWRLRFMQGLFNMASDSALFKTRADLIGMGGTLDGNRFIEGAMTYLPLLEGKMLWHFDHRFATYQGATQANLNKGTLPQTTEAQHADAMYGPMPEYWVVESEVTERISGRWDRRWLMGWRDITGTDKQRTVVASLMPPAAVGHTVPLLMSDLAPNQIASLYACLCSFVLDYAARQKVGGTHLTYAYLKQLPVLAPSVYDGETPWHPGVALRDFILPRVLELSYSSWDLQFFARDLGYEGPPFQWSSDRRFLLRAELDAAFFQLYGLSREDTDYVMDTFPIVAKNDEKTHGEYRTKRVVLEIFDEMVRAARLGQPYASRLDRPAGDPRVAHRDNRSLHSGHRP